MSAPLPQELIDQLTVDLGAQNVVVDQTQVEKLSRTCIPFREIPSVIVYPTNVKQVQAVVLAAKKFNVTIWPVSTGKNWGYGETTACYPDGITMILSRMNKIWHVDEKLGFAVLEPGVTYQQLNDHLKATKSSFWADVSGSTQSASVVGNALDKGVGVTPYADHFGQMCGLDVVLADGQILETGGGLQGNNHVRHVYRWGVGPYLDGIFAQSNYGIVVKSGIWLMPKPEVFDWAVFEYTASEDRFPQLMEDLRQLVFSGALRARPHLANDFAMMCIVSQYPNELLNGKRYLDEQAMATWRKKHGVARWTFGCGVYGSKEEVRFQKHNLSHVLGKYGALRFLGMAIREDWLGSIFRRIVPFALRAIGKSPAFLEALVPGINLFRGIPTDYFARQVYFKSHKNKPQTDIDPSRDQCGFLWIGPILPFTAEHVHKAFSLAKSISTKYEFDFFLEVLIENPRSIVFLLGVFYDRKDEADATRARAWYTEIRESFLQNGYPAYRTTTMSMAKSLDSNPVTKNFFNTLKKAIDPQNTIAPGRYGIDPQRQN